MAALWQALGLRPEQCCELVDFYHVVEHLYKLAGLKRKWTTRKRRQWVKRQRRGLLKGKLKQVLEEIKKCTSGRIGKELRRERNFFLRNARAGRLNHAAVAAKKLPVGSGSMESTVPRVVNRRLKGTGIFWHEESANAMFLLRSYYKARRWNLLERPLLTTDLPSGGEFVEGFPQLPVDVPGSPTWPRQKPGNLGPMPRLRLQRPGRLQARHASEVRHESNHAPHHHLSSSLFQAQWA